VAEETRSRGPEAEAEARLNAPDLGDDGEIDVERYCLPDDAAVGDPYLREVWALARAAFPGGQYAGGEPGDATPPTTLDAAP
jgi:hypothetical protein